MKKEEIKIGDVIRQYRHEHGISLREFANRVDVSKSYISMLENNKPSHSNSSIHPTLQTISHIAKAMGMHTYELVKIIMDE